MDILFTWIPAFAGMIVVQYIDTAASGRRINMPDLQGDYRTETAALLSLRTPLERGNSSDNLLKQIIFLGLCLGMATPVLASPNPPYNTSQSCSLVSLAYHTCQYPRYETVLSYSPQPTVQPSKKPITPSEKEDKKSLSKAHPRKKLLQETPIHTQRAWLYSVIIPGLGQLYNKSYWEIPVIYGVFGLLAWGAIYNHDEYMDSKRDLLKKMKEHGSEESGYPNLVNYMNSRKRDRTIFVASMFIWHLLNVFEAYVGGTLKTFDVSDDLEVVIQPNDNSSTPQNTSIGLSISLQSKNQDENRTHWVW